MKRCNCGKDYPHAITQKCSINIEEDYEPLDHIAVDKRILYGYKEEEK